MDSFLNLYKHIVRGSPVLLVCYLLVVLKAPLKVIVCSLLMNMLVSGLLWVTVKDAEFIIVQILAYLASFLWIWAESVRRKLERNDESPKDTGSKDEL